MNDHNLDDLIIGEPGSGSSGSKTLLSIVALAIVILIVGLILWALLFGSSNQKAPSATSPSQNQTQTLDPAVTPLETGNNEILPLTPVSVKTPTSPVPQSKPKPKPAPEPAPKPTPNTTPATEPVKKPTPAQSTPITQTTPSVPAGGQLIKNADKPIYYIQVGAFKNAPSPRFMEKLKNTGFTFITKITRGTRRVRVGPYDSYQEAKAALPVVKQKIGVDGLIVKF